MGKFLFSFGAIADIQHANKPNQVVGNALRRYRESIQKLSLAIKEWKGYSENVKPLNCVVQLGDLIDGNISEGLIRQDFERVAAAFDELGHIPVYHVVGNHCLECPREDVVSRLPALRQQEHCYYSVRIVEGWRLIVLDTSELSFHSGYGKDSDIWRESQLFYEQHPPSEHPQMAEWNGGIGARQMRWLEQALAGAAAAGDCVIVAAHHPIGSAQKCLRAWNWEEIHETLARWSSCVRLVLTGHDHLGGYGALAGIHYVTLEGVVESADDSNSYAVIEVREDAIEIHGRGVVSRVLPIG